MYATQDQWLDAVRQQAAAELRPLADAIDREKLYPESYLRHLGDIGGFAALGTAAEGGLGYGLAAQLQMLRALGRECGATAFTAWCQSACAWYLHQTRNQALKERYLKAVLDGSQLAGTGMSNTVKHLAGIEKHNLRAVREGDGYVVSGALPWVSNLGETHIFAATAQTDDGYVMFVLPANREGVTLKNCPEFCALEGTRTLTVVFRNVRVDDADVLAQPAEFADFIRRIKAGFILLQVGMGAGIVDGCIDIIADTERAQNGVNRWLDDGADSLKTRLDAAWKQALALAQAADREQHDILPVLKVRAAASELALDAAQSAALHAGAKGYLMHHPAQRRNREALFVAIVTPALKHLRHEIAALEEAAKAA
ncbi:alkylation response protein AidB-like acyl-CoA dehydrogenase [Neisseria sp. HSC-16F19]|nr:acyl-CoA dehydrogenase family protein [Neisseria sp. HSC-16F19]MCP2040226.1 alkylation response protein AidB-like acyl-CoA dehydrogenase [Neisseria sp. HSC-16F19]